MESFTNIISFLTPSYGLKSNGNSLIESNEINLGSVANGEGVALGSHDQFINNIKLQCYGSQS